MSLSLMGCAVNNIYSRNATNQIESVCSNCKQVDGVLPLIENVEKVMNTVQAVKGNYELVNTKETFEFAFDIITKDKKLNWELFADGKYGDQKLQFYARDKKFYIVYPYNGANVILKDDLQDMIVEIEDTLDELMVYLTSSGSGISRKQIEKKIFEELNSSSAKLDKLEDLCLQKKYKEANRLFRQYSTLP